MPTEVLQREIADLSDADIYLLVEYARFLKFRISTKLEQPVDEKSKKKKKRTRGFLSDAFISIASDFDETPDCMKEYI